MRRSIAMTGALLLALLSIPVATGLTSPGLAEAQSTGNFSSVERRRLRRGQLVTRQETQMRNGLRLFGGTAFQIIDAPPEVVWRAVRDIERWDRFVPQVVEARTVRRNARGQTIYLRHVHGPMEASYHLRVSFANPQRMAQFRLDRTRHHDIREGWGFFNLAPFGDGQTIITFGVMADVGSGLITGLVRPRVHEWMLRIPEELKQWVEGSGRARYTS